MFKKFLRVLQMLAGLSLAWLFTSSPFFQASPSVVGVVVSAVIFCDGLFSFQPKSK